MAELLNYPVSCNDLNINLGNKRFSVNPSTLNKPADMHYAVGIAIAVNHYEVQLMWNVSYGPKFAGRVIGENLPGDWNVFE